MPKTLEQIKSAFLPDMEAKLPNLISHERVLEDGSFGDYLHILFKTKKPYNINEVIDMLENDAQLHIAFHFMASDSLRGRQCVCAFAHPTNLHHYKFNVFSDDSNMVTDIHVNLFKDLEIYTATILGEKEELRSQGTFKREMDDDKILLTSLTCSDE